jgi:hypothetical protein
MKILKRVTITLSEEEKESLLTRSYGMFTRSGDKRLGEIIINRLQRGVTVQGDDHINGILDAVTKAANRNKKFTEVSDTAVQESLHATIEKLCKEVRA